MRMLMCPICGRYHEVKYHDPNFAIICDRYEIPIEISCFSITLLEHATKESCILKGFSEWKSIGITDKLQAEN